MRVALISGEGERQPLALNEPNDEEDNMGEIKFQGRGTARKVVPPYHQSYDACVACTFVCTPGAIEFEQVDGVRSLSPRYRDTRIQCCAVCGRPIATVDQLDALAASTGIPRNYLNICVNCRSTMVRYPAKRRTANPLKTETMDRTKHRISDV
jgi:hypothetical protein